MKQCEKHIYNHSCIKVLNKLFEQIIDFCVNVSTPEPNLLCSGFGIDCDCKKSETLSSLGERDIQCWGHGQGLELEGPYGLTV